MGGPGAPYGEREKREVAWIEQLQLTEDKKLERVRRIEHRAHARHTALVASISSDLDFIINQLNQLDSKASATYSHHDNDPTAPPAPSGSGNYSDDEDISGDLNHCLNYLEEFTAGGSPIKHAARPHDGSDTYFNYIVTFVEYLRAELSRVSFPQIALPSNPPNVDDKAYQRLVNDTDWIFQKLNAIFGTTYLPPVYGGNRDAFLQQYVEKIAIMFGKT